jgi:hypothetical protein
MYQHLIHFLTTELEIPQSHLRLASRRIPETPNQLPMMLWHYGLINLRQLEQIFDWLEAV